MQQDSHKIIRIAARNSPLSKIQAEEVCNELNKHLEGFEYDLIFVKTRGDHDQKSCLKGMEKTDFFTDAVDQLVENGEADIGVHSAKDLPEPLPEKLKIFALTKGLDSRDVLVLRQNMTLNDLPKEPKIGVSSERREKAIEKLIPQAKHVSIRGTIGERLRQLDNQDVDGVVIAHCALIRLGLTHRTKLFLEAEISPMQGKLAVVGLKQREDLEALFKPIDSRHLESALV